MKTAVSLLILALSVPAWGVEPPAVGTTFSQVQCEYLGLDWQEIYNETLDMGFDIIRIGAYWNRIEKEDGVFDFSELDWQIETAKRKNCPILLTVGMKAPRWPEYFIPGHILAELRKKPVHYVSSNKYVREGVMKFIREVLMRYRNEDIIYAWQVENEPFDKAGPKDWQIEEKFLQEEIALVKELDGLKRPIIINALAHPNTFLRLLSNLFYQKRPIDRSIDIADIPALDVYPVIGHKMGPLKYCFRSTSMELKSYLLDCFEKANKQGKVLWITELQAEPWEPGHLIYKGEKSITCWPGSYKDTFEDLRKMGGDVIFLWGAEYWFFRLKEYNDSSWLDTAAMLIKSTHSP